MGNETSFNGEPEQEFLKEYDGNKYEKPSVAVDLLIFTIVDGRLMIYLVKREEHPYKDKLSLPGVLVRIDEDLEAAALRGLKEKAGLEHIYLEQLYTWGEVGRDPRMRIISVSYMALVPFEKLVCANEQENIPESNLYEVHDIFAGEIDLAFDHEKIILYGRDRIKNKAEYTDIPFELLPENFTLPQLQRIYEILLGRELYKANFRKKVIELVEETGEILKEGAHRPSKLYRKVR